jgi:hypothetical protein
MWQPREGQKLTMFKPAHVWDTLRDRGYEVALDDGGRLRSQACG